MRCCCSPARHAPMRFGFQTTFHLVQGPTWVFGALGLCALLGELCFVLVLVSKTARIVLPALTAAMHVGILVVQNILFPDLIAIQAVFYNWRPLLRRFERVVRGAARSRAVAAAPGDVTDSFARVTR